MTEIDSGHTGEEIVWILVMLMDIEGVGY